MSEQRVSRDLSRAEALRRLGSVPFGRVVYTQRALPAIRAVNHVVLDGRVVICADEGTAIVGAGGDGAVVAYEAGEISQAERAGWSVMITGLARIVADRGEAARCQEAVDPWLAGKTGVVIQIEPGIVTGFELR
jgi:Pyridoxamine 5'-phosphate oxidase